MVGPCSLFDYSNQTITVGDNLKLNTPGLEKNYCGLILVSNY